MEKRTTRWLDLFSDEIEMAESARTNGNEGKARVCARRAAGVVIEEYFTRRGIPYSLPNAYVLLQKFEALDGLSPRVKEVAGYFLLRITPDHELPVETDLIAEARWLANELLDKGT
jgi:hypothetical protein